MEADRKAARPTPYINVLPSNGREPPSDWRPAQVTPFVIPKGINRGCNHDVAEEASDVWSSKPGHRERR